MKRFRIAFAALACPALLVVPAVAAQKPAHRNAWAPEQLTGTISMVDPALRVVVVKDSAGIPFDIQVNRATRIQAGDRQLKLKDLSSDVNKGVSLKFVPERRGDVARTIRLNG